MDFSALLKEEKNVPSERPVKNALVIDGEIFRSLNKEQALDRYILIRKLADSLQIRVIFMGMFQGKIYIGLNPDQLNSLFGTDLFISEEDLEEAKEQKKTGFFPYALSEGCAKELGIEEIVSLNHPHGDESLKQTARDFIARTSDPLIREFLICASISRSEKEKK